MDNERPSCSSMVERPLKKKKGRFDNLPTLMSYESPSDDVSVKELFCVRELLQKTWLVSLPWVDWGLVLCVVSWERMRVSWSSSGGQYRFEKIAIRPRVYDLYVTSGSGLIGVGGVKILKNALRPIVFEILDLNGFHIRKKSQKKKIIRQNHGYLYEIWCTNWSR